MFYSEPYSCVSRKKRHIRHIHLLGRPTAADCRGGVISDWEEEHYIGVAVPTAIAVLLIVVLGVVILYFKSKTSYLKEACETREIKSGVYNAEPIFAYGNVFSLEIERQLKSYNSLDMKIATIEEESLYSERYVEEQIGGSLELKDENENDGGLYEEINNATVNEYFQPI